MEPLKHLRMREETQAEFFKLQREIAVRENRRVTQGNLLDILITNYRKTHTQSKSAKRGSK